MNKPDIHEWFDEIFDFDDWAEVYRRDPAAFERRRAECIEQYINSAPAEIQPRLRGLMFRVDAERERARNPIDACVRLTGMMWDKFTDLQRELSNQINPGQPEPAARSAKVLPFRRPSVGTAKDSRSG